MTITDFLKFYPFIEELKTSYSPYRRASFFGFYLKGDPKYTMDMIQLMQNWLEQFILNLGRLIIVKIITKFLLQEVVYFQI